LYHAVHKLFINKMLQKLQKKSQQMTKLYQSINQFIEHEHAQSKRICLQSDQ